MAGTDHVVLDVPENKALNRPIPNPSFYASLLLTHRCYTRELAKRNLTLTDEDGVGVFEIPLGSAVFQVLRHEAENLNLEMDLSHLHLHSRNDIHSTPYVRVASRSVESCLALMDKFIFQPVAKALKGATVDRMLFGVNYEVERAVLTQERLAFAQAQEEFIRERTELIHKMQESLSPEERLKYVNQFVVFDLAWRK